jgi:AcrR family transcriptional regulator
MEKLDKRARILEAATKLFAELGYEGASTRQIAKEAGANMAMINYYFGSKEGVFMELMNDRIQSYKAELVSISNDNITVMEKLLRVVESYAQRILNNHSFHRMMQRELLLSQRPEMFDKIKNAKAENLMVFENIIVQGIEDGSFRPVDVRMLIATVMGTISNVALSPLKLSSDTTLDINKTKDRKIITERLTVYLKDLITTFLTPQK